MGEKKEERRDWRHCRHNALHILSCARACNVCCVYYYYYYSPVCEYSLAVILNVKRARRRNTISLKWAKYTETKDEARSFPYSVNGCAWVKRSRTSTRHAIFCQSRWRTAASSLCTKWSWEDEVTWEGQLADRWSITMGVSNLTNSRQVSVFFNN